jgi:hypothetical protein
MKWWIGLILGIIIGIGGSVIYNLQFTIYNSKKTETKIAERPLLKYTIENLGQREYKSQIVMDEITASNAAFFVQKFHFDTDGKNVTGIAHIPDSCDKCPVVVQIRGYADPGVYYPGYGTNRTAEEFAKAGFITLAPDFLSYGGSASSSSDVFEARFETYTTVLNFR